MIDWEDLALETAERFGGNLPHPDTAAAIAKVYARAPHAVTRAIDRVALEYEEGGIRSPWGILKSRVQQITTSEASTAKANDRDKAIARAEQWVRTAGLRFDRETEVLDELFGDRGTLREWPDLQSRIAALWHDLRLAGEQVEHEQQERLARISEQRAKMAASEPSESPEQRIARQKELAAHKAGIGNIDTRPIVQDPA